MQRITSLPEYEKKKIGMLTKRQNACLFWAVSFCRGTCALLVPVARETPRRNHIVDSSPNLAQKTSFFTKGNSTTRKNFALSSSMDAENNPVTRRKNRDRSSLRSVAAIGSTRAGKLEARSIWRTDVQPVLSTALLITGTTVGASCLVLPEAAAGSGLFLSTLLFIGAFTMNLISGLAIAEVAIKQHESSGTDVPSSFKEFAEVNLESNMAGNVVSVISMFVNICVVSFDLVQAGKVGESMLGGVMGASSFSISFAAVIACLVGTQSRGKLSGIASVAVIALFISYAGLLLPGLPSVHDPLGTFLAPGVNADTSSALAQGAPIVLFSMIYQNIVPSVTKILQYDRKKTAASLMLGSFIPLVMYLAWCYTVLGGGIDASLIGGPLLVAFSAAAVTGSALGSSMSITEELETHLKPQHVTPLHRRARNDSFSLPAAFAAVSVPLAVGLLFSGGEDFVAALSYAGAYGDPLLYGAIPVLMALTQRQKITALPNMVPGGKASLGILGMGSVAFISEELSKDVWSIINWL